jgi:hypothetical protein
LKMDTQKQLLAFLKIKRVYSRNLRDNVFQIGEVV